MSIINEALKKTQHKREDVLLSPSATQTKINAPPSPLSKRKWHMALSFSMLFLAITVLFILYWYRLFSLKPALPLPRNQFVLGGTFLSDHEKIALINNKIFHLGDAIENMKIAEIELNGVTLKNEKETVTLHTEARG